MKIYLCILSDQVLQNVLPLLSGQDPDYIAMAVSDDMAKKKAPEQFVKLLLGLGVITDPDKQIFRLDNAPSSNYEEIDAWAKAQISGLFQVDNNIKLTLNATGGKKLMSLALMDACRNPAYEDKVDIIYCDTLDGTIDTIYPLPYNQRLNPNTLNANQIIEAHSITIVQAQSRKTEWIERAKARRELSYYLAQHMGSGLSSFIGALNSALDKALQPNLEAAQYPASVSLDSARGIGPDWEKALNLMEKLNLIERNVQVPTDFDVLNVEAARYLHGVWLEEYFWLCFNEAGFADVVQCGVEISSTENDTTVVHNELDIIASNHNRLLVVECKTRNFEREQQLFNAGLQKLFTISRNIGGALTESWFATARWPNEKTEKGKELAERLRLQAKDRRVTLIEPRHLVNLTERLIEWKKTGRFPA